MASQTTEHICLLIVALFSVVHSFMDIEELQSINYGINILKEPIVIPETYPDSAILVTSRHGQQYQCNYPTHQEQKQQKEEEEKIALETGVVELLKPMSQQPCVLKTKDWWTYEICYGKYVRQYHVEDGQIRGNIMYLGHFQSDFDWNNETLRESRVKSKITSGRYHSQYYTNGSKCDLTGKGRETEVRYLCEDAEDDYIVRVDEPQTCVYVITVHTPRICSHPHLKSPTPSQPIPIVCAPLLTDQQYLQYQAHTEAMRQKEEEAKAKAKAEQEKREREKALAETKEEDENIESDLTDSLNSILKKSLGKEMKSVDSTTDESLSDGEDKLPLGWKLVKDLDDIEKLMDPQGILSNMDMSNKGQNAKSPSKTLPKEETMKSMNTKFDEVLGDLNKANQHKEGRQKSDDDDDDDDDEIDDAIEAAIESELNEFEQEVKNLRDKQAMTQKRLQQIKERVKKAVTSQFKDIIEEAEAEVGGEVNEDVAFKQLASSLNMLMEKVEHTEKEMKDMDREIAKLGGTEVSTAAGEGDGEEEERQEEGQEESQTEKEPKSGGVQAPPTSRQATDKQIKDGGRWKMKVRPVTQEEIDKDDSAKLLPTKQQKHLESSLKESLEKAGVDPNSVKVHVKIIGSMNSDKDDDATLHVLSEEESASFQNMIVAILGGSNEAVKEQKRHEFLEDSYNFVFDQVITQEGDTKSDSSSADSGDEGESDSAVVSDSVASMPEEGL